MKFLPSKKIYLLIYFVGINFLLSAQVNSGRIELGINAMAFIYQGDLAPSKFGSYKTLKPGAGIFASYKLNKLISLKTALAIGKLKGDDSKFSSPAWRQQRNFNFTTPVTEVSENLVLNIFKTAADGGPRLTPYLSAGVGYTFLHIRRDYSNYNAAYFVQDAGISSGLAADTAHSLPKGLLNFPVGGGVRYALTNNISLDVASAYRLNSSDYLDGFSLAANPARKDHYLTHSVGVIVGFSKKQNTLNCPVLHF